MNKILAKDYFSQNRDTSTIFHTFFTKNQCLEKRHRFENLDLCPTDLYLILIRYDRRTTRTKYETILDENSLIDRPIQKSHSIP